jgi:hypothetical protein
LVESDKSRKMIKNIRGKKEQKARSNSKEAKNRREVLASSKKGCGATVLSI